MRAVVADLQKNEGRWPIRAAAAAVMGGGSGARGSMVPGDEITGSLWIVDGFGF